MSYSIYPLSEADKALQIRSLEAMNGLHNIIDSYYRSFIVTGLISGLFLVLTILSLIIGSYIGAVAYCIASVVIGVFSYKSIKEYREAVQHLKELIENHNALFTEDKV